MSNARFTTSASLLLCCALLSTAGSGCAYWRDCWIRSNRAQALYCRALEHGKQGDSEAAILCLKEAVADNPHDVDARWELARLQLEAGQTDAAINELTYLVEHYPEDSRAFVQLAQMLHERGRDQVAQQLVELALRVDSHSEEALLLQGQIAEKTQDWPAALESYHQILSLQPEHLTARLRIAAVYQSRQEPETAAALLRETLVENTLSTTQRASIDHTLGRLYAELDRWDDAVESLANAVPQRGQDAELRYELAYARYQAGDAAGCRADLQLLLAQVPQHPTALALQQALNARPSQSFPASFPAGPIGPPELLGPQNSALLPAGFSRPAAR